MPYTQLYVSKITAKSTRIKYVFSCLRSGVVIANFEHSRHLFLSIEKLLKTLKNCFLKGTLT